MIKPHGADSGGCLCVRSVTGGLGHSVLYMKAFAMTAGQALRKLLGVIKKTFPEGIFIRLTSISSAGRFREDFGGT